MTDPGPDADLEHRIGALWEHNRHQDERIRDLQAWRTSVEAVSTWRRWALPLTFSAISLALTVLNVLVMRHH